MKMKHVAGAGFIGMAFTAFLVGLELLSENSGDRNIVDSDAVIIEDVSDNKEAE